MIRIQEALELKSAINELEVATRHAAPLRQQHHRLLMRVREREQRVRDLEAQVEAARRRAVRSSETARGGRVVDAAVADAMIQSLNSLTQTRSHVLLMSAEQRWSLVGAIALVADHAQKEAVAKLENRQHLPAWVHQKNSLAQRFCPAGAAALRGYSRDQIHQLYGDGQLEAVCRGTIKVDPVGPRLTLADLGISGKRAGKFVEAIRKCG